MTGEQLRVDKELVRGRAELRNESPAGRSWLRLRARGTRSNRSGLGTIVRVTNAAGTQTQTVRSGSSYASQSDLALTFGFGAGTAPVAVEVAWPSGTRQTFAAVPVNQTLTVDETRGLLPTAAPSGRPGPGAAALLR